MNIQQDDHTATFTAQAGYTGDNPSFVLWLATAFPFAGDLIAHAETLRAHGLTVDGVAHPAIAEADAAMAATDAVAEEDEDDSAR
jgi:hypothetical protein